ncbi:tyrosine phosphatase [Aphelenchoides avenae]|nr:tyrosine phosphatase [Aphelenchus avenae]
MFNLFKSSQESTGSQGRKGKAKKPKTDQKGTKQSRETFVPPGKPKKTSNDPVTTNHLSAEPLKRTSRNVPKAAPQEPLLEKACLDFVRLARSAGLAAIKREWMEVAAHVPSSTSARCYASNPTKNVLGSVPCLDATRVNLTFEVPPKEDYIHANWVTTTQCQLGVRLILAQAPQSNTVDDFWRMVWQEKVQSIVMLCGKYEGRSACPQYWPGANGTLTYGSITVAYQEDMTSKNDANAYKRYGFTVTHADEQPFRANIYVFHNWSEGGIPVDTTVQLLRVVRTVDSEGGTAVIHGAIGVGRPGVFAALAIALKTLKEGRVCSLPAIVKEIRSQRMGAVATEIQYLYIYAAICEYMRRKEIEANAATHFYNKFLAYHKQYVEAKNRPVPVFEHTRPGGSNPMSNVTATQDIGRSPIGADQAPPRPLATQITAAPNNANRPPTSPAAGPSDRAVAIAPLVQDTNTPQPPQDAKPGDDTGNPYWCKQDIAETCNFFAILESDVYAHSFTREECTAS